MKRLIPSLSVFALLALAPRAASAQVAQGCSFNKDHPIPETSSLADQFKCYQQSGRHVRVDGQPGMDDQGSFLTRPEPTCVRAVAVDRVQLGPCRAIMNSGSFIIPFASIRFVSDDPNSDVMIYTRQ